MPSSNGPYTLTKQQTKRRWVLSTSLLAVAAVAGGIGIDYYLNPVTGGSPTDQVTNSTSATPVDARATGDTVQYRYGAIQLEVVRAGGKLTEVNLIQAGANGGREAAFPYLQQYALDAQGTSFSNLSGATFTSDAFKQALSSAISKLG